MQDYRPLNPWGRAMPKASPSRGPQCQLFVSRRTERDTIPVGPRMERQYLEPLCEQINKSASLGAESNWHDARVVQLGTTRPPARRSGLRVVDVLKNPSLLEL